MLALIERGAELAVEIHAESGIAWRTAIYPLDRRRVDALAAERHGRILLAAALYHDVQNGRPPSIAAFTELCDLILAGPSEALSDRLESLRDVRFHLRRAYDLPPGGLAFSASWFDPAA